MWFISAWSVWREEQRWIWGGFSGILAKNSQRRTVNSSFVFGQ